VFTLLHVHSVQILFSAALDNTLLSKRLYKQEWPQQAIKIRDWGRWTWLFTSVKLSAYMHFL